MGDYVGGRALKRLHQRRLNFIDGSIPSYCSILNSPEQLDLIKQANKLASVTGDIESDHLGEKEDRKKIATEEEDQRNKKAEQKQMREDEERLKGLETCEDLVHPVLAFGMDHINNIKLKELRVLLCYHFGSEKLKGTPKKLELVEAFTEAFRKDWEGVTGN